MVNENTARAEARKPEEAPKILTKPLPQILDEMDQNIRVAAEAATRAEEAAKAARDAAAAATKGIQRSRKQS